MSHRWQTYAAQFWRARRRHISKCDDGQLLTATNNPIVVRLIILIIRILVAIATRLSAFAFLFLDKPRHHGKQHRLIVVLHAFRSQRPRRHCRGAVRTSATEIAASFDLTVTGKRPPAMGSASLVVGDSFARVFQFRTNGELVV